MPLTASFWIRKWKNENSWIYFSTALRKIYCSKYMLHYANIMQILGILITKPPCNSLIFIFKKRYIMCVGLKMHLRKIKAMCNKHVNRMMWLSLERKSKRSTHMYTSGRWWLRTMTRYKKWKRESDRVRVHTASWTTSCETKMCQWDWRGKHLTNVYSQ